jgi:tryptophan synthase alpha chain
VNRISQAFLNKKGFVAFVTGGDPDIETTENVIVAMAEAGVDVIEIGIPFSDPVAEGIVIQDASARSLANGCTVDKLFEMVQKVRTKTAIPLLFMTYMNPVLAYGTRNFMERCAQCGLDGVIVPDLPFEEKDELTGDCKDFGISLISMIAPTSADRVEKIVKDAEGFIYCVSSLGVTGVRQEINPEVAAMISQAKKVTNVPCAVGFGISTPEQAQEMANIADGVIIGSAIVKIILEHGRESVEPVREFVGRVRRAL